MKKVDVFKLTLIFLLINSCNSQKICLTPDMLCENVLDSFVNNDIKSFTNFYLNDEYMRFGLKGKLIEYSPKEAENIIKQETYSIKKEIKFAKYRWRKIRKEIENLGVNWSEIEYISPKYEVINWRWSNFKKADVELCFKYNSSFYVIYLNNCFKTANGWKLSHAPNFRGVYLE